MKFPAGRQNVIDAISTFAHFNRPQSKWNLLPFRHWDRNREAFPTEQLGEASLEMDHVIRNVSAQYFAHP
ncbi:hypothetical protein chiPu_0008604 [Chiloscyllium punctatum]|uniref:Uncharacterized protein n=1 Tax=Chiloscyllium punctatum TaxID=137246 RepID=A0A401SIC5_CHIPU|nr:hypothetical protein [Chiloscyllium punctatum]